MNRSKFKSHTFIQFTGLYRMLLFFNITLPYISKQFYEILKQNYSNAKNNLNCKTDEYYLYFMIITIYSSQVSS